eukprot:CAMPEP_0194559230 /NCGR_PEP_ID=MMETSP0292-20121207/849_1 /TAXON_ID=39354 /ORGANISM="Heterosigma akashiwo, Strain CCMP2393" /LENGTH=340 /DNA_ID=CAMNT_0039407079 /DNA_START=110 /DNA_END=1132 /DNA_ORIENTATION=-
MKYLSFRALLVFAAVVNLAIFLGATETSIDDFCSESDRKLRSLLLWFEANGGYINPNLDYVNDGMFATRGPIDAGEVLAAVPEKLVFNPFREETGKLAQPDDLHLAQELIEQRENSSSFFFPYLSWLPTSCQNPLCWDLNKISTITSHAFLEHVIRIRRAVTDGSEDPSFLTALSVIQSRRFDSGLIPILDMFNHDRNKGQAMGKLVESSGNDDSAAMLGIVAKTNYSLNEETFNSYVAEGEANVGSATILYLYGFVQEDVSKDTCHDAIHVRHPKYNKEWRRGCILQLAAGPAKVAKDSIWNEVLAAKLVGDNVWEEVFPIHFFLEEEEHYFSNDTRIV